MYSRWSCEIHYLDSSIAENLLAATHVFGKCTTIEEYGRAGNEYLEIVHKNIAVIDGDAFAFIWDCMDYHNTSTCLEHQEYFMDKILLLLQRCLDGKRVYYDYVEFTESSGDWTDYENEDSDGDWYFSLSYTSKYRTITPLA